MATTVYSIMHSDGIFYEPTLALARATARHAKADPDDDTVSITRCVVADSLGKRELYCALLNNEGWAVEQEQVT